MKKTIFFSIILAVVLLLPPSAFAIVDVGAYGGYSFDGNWQKPEINGSELGVISHISFTLAKVVTLGLGGYYQKSFNSIVDPYSGGTNQDKYTKDSIGLDGFVQLNIPTVVIHPYGRASTSIWDNSKGFRFKSYKDATLSEFFKTYAFGGGISFPIVSLPVIKNLHLFIEYLYTISQVKGNELNTHTIHSGVRIFI